jgi:hypothetical protein
MTCLCLYLRCDALYTNFHVYSCFCAQGASLRASKHTTFRVGEKVRSSRGEGVVRRALWDGSYEVSAMSTAQMGISSESYALAPPLVYVMPVGGPRACCM